MRTSNTQAKPHGSALKVGTPYIAGTAFIVGDDPKYSQLLALIVKGLGFTVQQAATISRARRMFQKCSPELAIIDGHLPDGSGLDLCRYVREEYCNTRTLIIVITSKANILGNPEWLEAGADQCWPKISNTERLTALITGLIRREQWDTKIIKP